MKTMKRRFWRLALAAAFALAAGGCDEIQSALDKEGAKQGEGDMLTVTFHLNAGEAPGEVALVSKNQPVARPEPMPAREGFTFVDWYRDNETFEALYNFDTPVEENLDLYALWTRDDPENPAPDPSEYDLIYEVFDADGWGVAAAGINDGGDGKKYVININGDFSLAGADAATFSAQSLNVLIRANGQALSRTLSLNSRGSLLTVAAGQTVTLSSVTLCGINETNKAGTEESNNRALVVVDGGALFLQGAAALTNNVNTYSLGGGCGGGVCVLNGGSVTLKDSAAVSGNKAASGGGIYTEGTVTLQADASAFGNSSTSGGGGVYVATNGSVTLKGNATVRQNGDTTNQGAGGGIHTAGTVTLQDDASVFGNDSKGNGGGVFIAATGSVTLKGRAKVSGNQVGTGNGGGVFIAGNNEARGRFDMYDDAVVSGNTVSVHGGGVYVAGMFTMRGNAAVSGNTANTHGGGIHLNDNGKFYIESGVIYGGDVDAPLKNTANSNHALNNSGGAAQRGTFNGDTFTQGQNLSSSNDTIRVSNEALP